MSAPYFLDTNILIYATSLATDHATKRPAARNWVARTDWGLSTQVLMEFYANARQARHGLLPTAPQTFVERIAASRLSLRNRYNLSHWDAAILCAAARLGAHTVISEDLSHGQRYDGITVLNPFLG